MSPADVASVVVDNTPGLQLTKQTEDAAINRTPIPHGQALYAKCLAPLSHHFNPETNLKLFTDPGFIAEVRKEIVVILKARKTSEKGEQFEARKVLKFNPSITCPIGKLQYIRNVEQGGGVLYDPLTDKMYEYHKDVIEDTLARKLGDGVADWYGTNEKQCYFQYYPFQERFFTSKEDGHEVFNQWKKPAYQIGWVPTLEQAVLPPATQEFLNLLSPNHHLLLLAWLKDMVWGRAEPILIFRGAPGCGKNMFADYLAAGLVGKAPPSNNWARAKRDFAEARFNAYIGTKQVLVFDEQKMGFGFMEVLKDLHNGIATLEEKNKRVTGSSDIFCSMIAITNHRKNVEVHYDDRKFFIPTCGTKKLADVKGKPWVMHLIKKEWVEFETLRQIASYLKFKVAHIEDFPIETPHFLELCWLNSIPEYFKRFLTFAVNNKQFTEKQYWKNKKAAMPELHTLQDQISMFESNRRLTEPIGKFHVTRTSPSWTFVSNIYKREDLIMRYEGVVYDDEGEGGDIEEDSEGNVV